MNDILINALLSRVKAEDMDIAQVPMPYQEEITKRLDERVIEDGKQEV